MLLLPLLLSFPAALRAAEGGTSNYLQGTYGDFAMGNLGPAGFYMRDDPYYYAADVDIRLQGGRIDAGVTERLWGNLCKFSYVYDQLNGFLLENLR